MGAAVIARLLVIALLVAAAICLVTGIRVLLHDGWQRLAWAVVRLSEAAPKAAEAIARLGDHVAAWLAVRAIKDAPGRRQAPGAKPPFDPAPKPDGPDPAAARADEPSAAEMTRFDVPLIPDRERPYLERRPFGRAVAMVTKPRERTWSAP
jgi:hypothetical protein